MPIKIINADDMGISPGVNSAVVQGFYKGILNSTSLMMNVAYTNQAVRLLKKCPGLAVGIHLNLTRQRNQKPLAAIKKIPLLTDQNGYLKHGFLGLLILSVFRPKALRTQAEAEMRAQIDHAFRMGICPVHLDSHRHIHMIPVLFGVVKKLAREYHIKRIRVVNECFWKTFLKTRNLSCVFDGGLVKLLILKFLNLFNRTKSDTYFYGVLHTTRLFGQNICAVKVPSCYKRVEIGIHPSDMIMDQHAFEPAFFDYLLDRLDRQKEFETILDEQLLKKISY